MALYNKISEDVFMKARALFEVGKTPLEVANFCRFGRETAKKISNTKTYEEWLANTAERTAKEKERRDVEPKKTGITRTKITENIYNAVKLILKGGSGTKEAAQVMGISTNSVLRIEKASSYADYIETAYQNGSARYKKQEPKPEPEPPKQEPPKQEAPAQVVEHKQTVVVQATWQMTQEMRKTNELLAAISSKLAFIVEELTGKAPDAKLEESKGK